MNNVSIQQAVMSLRPGAEWTMNGDDVEGIIWHTEGVEPLTTAEVKAEIARLEQAAVDEAAARAAKLESARAKLAALGLDVDEVNAVIGVSA
jgi:hypothetical protein